MVALDRPERNRGQLILIGCLSLALVIIGIGLVINTTLYTESASPALSNVQIDDASTFHLETQRGTRSLVHRINHGDPVRNADGLEELVTSGVANYSSLMAMSYARTEPASVNISYDHDNSTRGTRVVQRSDGDFDDSIQGELSGDQQIGWLAMNVNVSATNVRPNPFSLTIEGDDTVEWRIYRNETGVATNLTVESTLDNGTTYEKSAHCNPVRNRVLLDGYTGELVADECIGNETMYGVTDLEDSHTIDGIERSDKFNGKWELVTNGSVGSDIPSCSGTGGSNPTFCQAPAVWTANVTASYQGQDASYERDRDVTIYGGGR